MKKILTSIVNVLKDPWVNIFVSVILLILVFCGIYNSGDTFDPVSFVFGAIMIVSMSIWDYGTGELIKRFREKRMTKQEIEKKVDQMSADQLREFAIIGFMISFRMFHRILNSLPGKGSQGKP